MPSPVSVLKSGGAALLFVSLQSELSNIASGINDEVKAVMKDQAEKMASSAKSKAPVDSGELRDSIEVYEYERPGISGFRVRAGAKSDRGVPYAHMVEYGSVHGNAQPFLLPAMEEHRQETIDAVNDKLDELGNG